MPSSNVERPPCHGTPKSASYQPSFLLIVPLLFACKFPLVSELAERDERAGSDAERLQRLDALGKTADATPFRSLKLRSARPRFALRVAAAKNLRLLPAPHADELLGPLILGLADSELRRAELFAAGFRRFEVLRSVLEKFMREEPMPSFASWA